MQRYGSDRRNDKRRRFPRIWLLVCGALLLCGTLPAQEPPADPDPDKPVEEPIEDPKPGDGGAAAAASSGSSANPGIPGANSSLPGANDLLNFQTDLFTGRFSYSVPIIVAPGRGGAEPKLALTYNSSAGNGWCGVGWSLEVGYIERDTKKGVPVKWGLRDPLTEYDNAAGFVFNLGGANGSLVNVGGSEYRNEIDGAFLKFIFDGSYYWRVTDKSGNNFFFGENPQSRMDHPHTGWTTNLSKGTFRWALNRVVDVNGNETVLKYTQIDEYLYLTNITYNANTNGGVSATHSVDFILGHARTDLPISFRSNYRVQLKKRLSEVIIKANGQRVRRYDLTYTNSPSTFRSLLHSVILYGTNDSSSLPPLTFTYQVKPFEFHNAVAWEGVKDQGQGEDFAAIHSTHTDSVNDHGVAALQDIDGDALPDRVMRKFGSPYSHYLAQRNTGSNFVSTLKEWGPLTSQSQTTPAWGGLHIVDANGAGHLRFTDINGDGYPDRVMRGISGGQFVVELNTGLQGANAAFGAPGVIWPPLEHESATGYEWEGMAYNDNQNAIVLVDFMDINGDSLPDRVMRKESANYTHLVVQHNMGSFFTGWRRSGQLLNQGTPSDPGLGAIADTATDLYDPGQSFNLLLMIDINGDGLADRVMTKSAAQRTNFVVQFNRGVNFSLIEDPWGQIDAQGVPDDRKSWRSPYSNYYPPQPPGSHKEGVQCLLIDMNGDGLPDRVMRKLDAPYTDFKVQFNHGSGFTSSYDFGPVQNVSTWWQASPRWVHREDNYLMTDADLADINGDGLPDRIWYESPTTWKVQFSKGPFPDLLSRIENGTGGKVDVTYAPSTKFNNRDKSLGPDGPWVEGARALLPFVVYVVKSVATRDGFSNTNQFTYDYEGGMYDGKRREFRGFNRATTRDVFGAMKHVYFHQGGGQNRPSEGEFGDADAVAKKGIPYRTQTIGTNGMMNTLTINKVEEAMLHTNGWCFPYISQTIQLEYDGLATYRATAQRFLYDTNTGNQLKVSNLGEVYNVDIAAHTFNDLGADAIYTHTAYTNLGEIVSKPSSVKITADDAGTIKLRETLFEYDARGNLTTEQAWSGTTYLTTASIAYDIYGNPVRTTDAAGITTTNTYDSTYRMFVEEKITGGFTNIFRYDPHSGGVVWAIDAKGIVSSNVYDTFFRLTATWVSTNAYGPASLWQERYTYNLGGVAANVSYNFVRKQVFDPVDTNGHDTYVYADGLGRTIQTRVEAETGQFRVTDDFYDLGGKPVFTTLPRFGSGSAFTMITGTNLGAYTEYDAFGRAYKATPAVEVVFDSNGDFADIYATGGDSGSPVAATVTAFSDGTNPWATVVTDPEGKVRKSYHDAFGRTTNIVEVTSGGNYVTTYKYDLLGNLTNVTDHAENKTRIVYDNLGRKTSLVDPDMGTWSYAYDNASRLVQQTDAKNQKIEFVYTEDAAGRLTARKIYNASQALVATISYVYDTNQGETEYFVPKGALFKVTDREGWIKFGYDARGRATKVTRYVSTNQTSYTILTEYDDADRVVTLTYPGTPETKLKYLYDTAGHLKEIHSLAGLAVSETFYSLPVFNPAGQLTSVKYGANQIINYSYFAKSKRLQGKTTAVSTNLQNLAYKYDRAANVTNIIDAARPSGTNSATITSFTYDDLHRLTQINSAALGLRSYIYNPIGNIIVNGDFGAGFYGYTAARPHAVVGVDDKSYEYDACGNMTLRNIQVLEYDEENRLRRVSYPSPEIRFGYADDGTRLWRKSSRSGLTVWIGGIYEERAGKRLCHVYADGQLIATFEQGGFLASLPQNRAVAQLASAATTLERCFNWPFQHGRTPITVMLATLLGILCVSVLSRWREIRGFYRSTRRSRSEIKAKLLSLRPSRPSVENSPFDVGCRRSRSDRSSMLDVQSSKTSLPRLGHQLLSILLIVCLVLTTTQTNVHAQSYDPVFYYYHPDHLGSSNIITDRNGVIVQQYEYTAYGQERVRISDAAFTLTDRYTGQEFDDETGLYFFQSRYYDPELGRFIQPDSIVPNAGDPQSLNRYTYAANSPYNFTDPTGHSSEPALWDTPWYWQSHDLSWIGFNNPVTQLITAMNRFDAGLKDFASAIATVAADQHYAQLSGIYADEIKADLAHKANIEAGRNQMYDQYWNTLMAAHSRESTRNWQNQQLKNNSDGGSGLSYIQKWQHTPTVMFERHLIKIADMSTMMLPGGGIARGAKGVIAAAGRAGKFSDLERLAVVGDRLTPHHMPQAALGFTSRADGGAIMIKESEHVLTRTYFSRGAVLAQQEAGLPFRTILARDIRDLRGIAGVNYNQGIKDLLQYYRQNFPSLIAKPTRKP